MTPERVKLAKEIFVMHKAVTDRVAKRGARDFLSGLVQGYAIVYGFNNNTTALHDALEVAG